MELTLIPLLVGVIDPRNPADCWRRNLYQLALIIKGVGTLPQQTDGMALGRAIVAVGFIADDERCRPAALRLGRSGPGEHDEAARIGLHPRVIHPLARPRRSDPRLKVGVGFDQRVKLRRQPCLQVAFRRLHHQLRHRVMHDLETLSTESQLRLANLRAPFERDPVTRWVGRHVQRLTLIRRVVETDQTGDRVADGDLN